MTNRDIDNNSQKNFRMVEKWRNAPFFFDTTCVDACSRARYQSIKKFAREKLLGNVEKIRALREGGGTGRGREFEKARQSPFFSISVSSFPFPGRSPAPEIAPIACLRETFFNFVLSYIFFVLLVRFYLFLIYSDFYFPVLFCKLNYRNVR